MKVWGQKEQRPPFPQQFLLCSLRVCKAHVLPVAVMGRRGMSGQGSLLCPSTFLRKVALVLHWSWTRARCLPGNPERFQMWHSGLVWGQHRQLPLAFGKTQEGKAALAAWKCFLMQQQTLLMSSLAFLGFHQTNSLIWILGRAWLLIQVLWTLVSCALSLLALKSLTALCRGPAIPVLTSVGILLCGLVLASFQPWHWLEPWKENCLPEVKMILL